MAEKSEELLPVAPLPDLLEWLRSQQVRGIVIGGLAVAFLGRPRATRDVDLLVLLPEERWPAFLEAARTFDFTPRVPDALTFARESHVLLLRHQKSGVEVDVSLGSLPFEEEAVARARKIQVAGVALLLPTPEDLVIMKAVAHRERDRLDIDSLLAVHPRLDKRRIRRWVREFADILNLPEIYDDLNRQLSRRRPRKPGKGKT